MTETVDDAPVRILEANVLADDWAKLTKYTIDYRRRDGGHETQIRQVYDRGNGACLLPYDPDRGTVLLVRQFRMPVWMNSKGGGGWLIEACAGLLDDLEPEAAIRREAEEELGYRLGGIHRMHDIYMKLRAASASGWRSSLRAIRRPIGSLPVAATSMRARISRCWSRPLTRRSK